MATLAEVQVKINADLAPLRSAFAKAKSMSSDLDKALNKSRKTMSATFKVDNSVRDRAADIAAYGKSLDDLRAKYNPLFAAQRDYRAQLSDIKRALDVGAISQTEYTAAIARTRTEFSKTFAAMRQSGDGLGQFNTAARGSDIEAYAKSLDDLKAKYNPVFAVQRRYANELHDIRRALKVGAITQEEYNAAICAALMMRLWHKSQV
jgi:chromosome segregation ATPase